MLRVTHLVLFTGQENQSMERSTGHLAYQMEMVSWHGLQGPLLTGASSLRPLSFFLFIGRQIKKSEPCMYWPFPDSCTSSSFKFNLLKGSQPHV